MKYYNVTGMSCAACQARVEKTVSKIPGVTSCTVSLLTNSMTVEGDVSDSAIIKAVKKAGYGASLKKGNVRGEGSLSPEEKEISRLTKRLFLSLGFLLALMYVSMGHGSLGLPLPSFLSEKPIALGIIQAVLALIVMLINGKFFISGFSGIVRLSPNMDTLVALGSGASYIRSLVALILMIRDYYGGITGFEERAGDFYFESAAMILALITVGKTLEAKSKGKTTSAIRALTKLTPSVATVIRDGSEEKVPVSEVKTGDIFVVRPGESIPVDGIVTDGETAVNEAALTGESIPADKAPGDTVSAATVNQTGFITCRATSVGDDTFISKIIKAVSDASASKAPIQRIADKVSGIFVPAILGLSLITFVIWFLIGLPVSHALTRAISVLVISCPCALGLATPVAIMVGSGVGAKKGILFKSAESLEEAGKIKFAVFDKTGTLTKGEPEVKGIFPIDALSEKELLSIAAAAENRSGHPLAKAVVRKALESGAEIPEVTDFLSLTGNGVSALLDGEKIVCGSEKFVSSQFEIPSVFREKCDEASEKGYTPLLFVKGKTFIGMIPVADTLKDDAKAAVGEIRKMGITPVMLTGDNERTAKAIGKLAGIDEIIAGVLPDEKEKEISALKKRGKVAMIGDGINDAPALTSADIGIAIGAGTDVAIDAADVVLIGDGISGVPAAIRLSRNTLRNIRENLFWAFFYNALCIPLAAGVFAFLLGWELSPMIAAAAMSLSSLTVVTNALRLNLKKR